MIARPVTWSRALRALAVAVLSVLVLVLVATNFVLVDVRLWVLDVQMRLGWAVAGAAGLGFAFGALCSSIGGATRAAASVTLSAAPRHHAIRSEHVVDRSPDMRASRGRRGR